MTEPHKPDPTPTPGSYRAVLPADATPPQGSRRRHGTPGAGIEVPRSRPAGAERTTPPSLPQSHLRGLGSDPALPPRSKVYGDALDGAPDDAGRWRVQREYTGGLLDGHDALVRSSGHLSNAVNLLNSATEEMRLAIGLELGVVGGKGKAMASANARAVERVGQLEGDLHGARSELATIKRNLTARQVGTAGGVGTILTAIIGTIMYLTGHWK